MFCQFIPLFLEKNYIVVNLTKGGASVFIINKNE